MSKFIGCNILSVHRYLYKHATQKVMDYLVYRGTNLPITIYYQVIDYFDGDIFN